MKIIEALKEIPLLTKRINSNLDKITEYAAGVDNGDGGFKFESPQRQIDEVAALIQSNEDLVARRALLRKQLYVTNSTVEVTIGGMTKTISEWIEYRQHGFESLRQTYHSLNERQAINVMKQTQMNPTQGIRVVRFFDEVVKNEKINKITNIQDSLDAQLEIINATTDLIES